MTYHNDFALPFCPYASRQFDMRLLDAVLRKKMKLSNIDVTLRDGGYRNLFHFSEDYAKQHVKMMDRTGVEWIEIGYRNGSFKPIDNIG